MSKLFKILKILALAPFYVVNFMIELYVDSWEVAINEEKRLTQKHPTTLKLDKLFFVALLCCLLGMLGAVLAEQVL